LLCVLAALFARALTQCNVKELLNNVGSAAAAAPAAAATAAAAPAADAKKEEKKEDKKEESESEDEDMGFGKSKINGFFCVLYYVVNDFMTLSVAHCTWCVLQA